MSIFATLVDTQRIGENDYNIAVSSYVEKEDTCEMANIKELKKEITQIVVRQNELRTAIDEIVADIEGYNEKAPKERTLVFPQAG